MKTIIKHALGLLPLSWRYGSRYKATKRLIAQSDSWSAEQHAEYQLSELKKLLRHAEQFVPYYQDLWRQHGIAAQDVSSLEDFRKLPTLARDVLQSQSSRLNATAPIRHPLCTVSTGGSTAEPIQFTEFRSDRRQVEQAYLDAIWKRLGSSPGDRCATLRGEIIEAHRDGLHYRYDPHRRTLALSSYHLTEDTAPRYADLMRRYRVRNLKAYPSSASLFAKLLETTPQAFPHLRHVFCASEMLYDWQRELMQSVFGCRVSAHYGLTERVLLAGECEHSTAYHFFPQYGILELIDDDGSPITEAGCAGEIVGTGFTNYATPFIRYRTGDRGVWAKANDCCERAYPVLERIEGRLQEMIVTSSGRQISMTAINMHSDVFAHVLEFQFHQQRKGHVMLNLLPSRSFNNDEMERIRHEVQMKLGNDMMLEIHTVPTLNRSSRGKRGFLIQDLNLDAGAP